jgi:flagellar basal-body rod modification protein FlgD
MTEVAATSSNSTSSASSAASQTLLGSYDLFLTLLTTQIQNQDPLDPLDSAEYTNQLVQYSSVEQSIQTNAHLEQMVAQMTANQATGYVSYLGTQVTANGDTTMLADGSANWSYSLDEDASGTVEIRNANGAVVFSDTVELSGGNGTYQWDGMGDSNTTLPDGAYTIAFDVKDSAGNAEPVETEFTGTVDEVDLSSDTPYLTIGTIRIPVSSVLSVSS